MADPSLPKDKVDPEAMKRQIQSQHRRVLGLRAQLYSQTDPSTGEGLRQRLADEEATLRRLEDEAKDLPSPPSPEGHVPRFGSLGPDARAQDHGTSGRAEAAHEAPPHGGLSISSTPRPIHS